MTDGNTIRSVAKAMELLQLLSDAGEAMTLTAISERAGLPKSTVFGLLTTMRDYDVITQHADGKYALGLRLFEYGCRASAFWNISSLARPYLAHLVDETGETVDEMLDAIAERYFKINCAVFTPNDQRMKDIVQMAKDLHADGIVDVALQFCTLYEMESFAVEKAAEEAGIPFMHITTDYAGEDAGQLQTRIEAFLETI